METPPSHPGGTGWPRESHYFECGIVCKQTSKNRGKHTELACQGILTLDTASKTNRFCKRSRRRENAPRCYTSSRWNPPLQFGQISRRAHSACGPVPQGSSHLQVGWTQRCQRIRCCGNRWGRELKSLYYIVKMSHGKFLLEQCKYFILSNFMRNMPFPGQEMHKPWNTSPFKYFSSAAFKNYF